MSARAAQEELRDVVGVLRDDGTDSSAVPPPHPTLIDVPNLVAESQRAGMDVVSRIELGVDEVPPLIGRTATGSPRRLSPTRESTPPASVFRLPSPAARAPR